MLKKLGVITIFLLFNIQNVSGIPQIPADRIPLERLPDGARDNVEDVLLSGDSTLVFLGFTSLEGYELWGFDGIRSRLLADINEAPTGPSFEGSSFPSNYVVLNGDLYFSANLPTTGTELFKLDGVTGEISLYDIKPGSLGSSPSGITEYQGCLYFGATTDFQVGRQLHKFDPISEDISLVSNDLFSPVLFKKAANSLYFWATRSDVGEDIFRIDSTGEVSLVGDFTSTGGGAAPLFEVRGGLYFVSRTHLTSGSSALHRLDLETDQLIKITLADGTELLRSSAFTEFNGEIHLSSETSDVGQELFKLDGDTGFASLVEDILPGTNSSGPKDLSVLAGNLYFHASNPDFGREIHEIDGVTGVLSVIDLLPGTTSGHPNSSNPQDSAVFMNDLYFTATTPEGDRELFQLRVGGGGPTVTLLENIAPEPGGNINKQRTVAVVNNTLTFVGNVNEEINFYSFDGNSLQTVSPRVTDPLSLIKDISRVVEGNFITR